MVKLTHIQIELGNRNMNNSIQCWFVSFPLNFKLFQDKKVHYLPTALSPNSRTVPRTWQGINKYFLNEG